MTFEDFVARKDELRQRAEIGRVTWRKVSPDTGGGWSGYGRDGRLVYVRLVEPTRSEPTGGRYVYGHRIGKVAHAAGRAWTVTEAKRRAAELTLRDELWTEAS